MALLCGVSSVPEVAFLVAVLFSRKEWLRQFFGIF
jgi:hypothetical protein